MGADPDRSGTVRVELDADASFTVAAPPRLDGTPVDPRVERLAAARRRRDSTVEQPLASAPSTTATQWSADPDDEPGAAMSDRGRVVVLGGLVTVLALVAALVIGARPEAGRTASDDPIVAPTTTAAPTPLDLSDAESVLDGVAQLGEAVPVSQLGPIEHVVPFRGRWFAVMGLRGSERIVTSPDAANWFELELDLPEGDIVGLGVNDGDLVVANATGGGLGIAGAAPGELSLRLWRSADGIDFVIAERIAVSPNSIAGFSDIGEDAMVFVLQSLTREPVPEISDLLVELGADRDAADRTCQLDRNVVDLVIIYTLLGCDGAEVGELVDPGARDDDRLSFANELLTFRYEYAVATDAMGEHIVSVQAGRLLRSVAATDDGILSIAVDSLDGLRDPNQFFAGGLIATMQLWRPDTGFVEIEPPRQTRGWWNSEVELLDDGRVLNVIADEVFVASAPFDSWDVVASWDDRLTPGGIQLVGDTGWMARPAVDTTGIGPDRMWVTRMGEDWREVSVVGETVVTVLTATDSGLLVELRSGRLIEVPYGAIGEPFLTPAAVSAEIDPEVKPRPLESREWIFPVLTEAFDGQGYVGLSNENGSTLFFESPNGLDWDVDVLTDLPFSLFVRALDTTSTGYRVFGRIGMFEDAVFVSEDGVQWQREPMGLPRGANAVELRSYSASATARSASGVLGWPDDLARSEDFLLWWDTGSDQPPTDVPVRPCTEPNGRCEIVSIAAQSDGVLVVHRAEQNFTLSRWTAADGWRQVAADLPLPSQAPRLRPGVSPGEVWYVSNDRILFSADEGATWEDRFVRIVGTDGQFVEVSRDGSIALLDAGDRYIVATENTAVAYSKSDLRSLAIEAVSADGVVLTGIGREGQSLILLDGP